MLVPVRHLQVHGPGLSYEVKAYVNSTKNAGKEFVILDLGTYPAKYSIFMDFVTCNNVAEALRQVLTDWELTHTATEEQPEVVAHS